MKIGELIPDARNARAHNERNLGVLSEGMQEVGFARSIVIDENNVILAGNATIEAAGQIGLEKVQVIDVDGETIVAVRRTGLTDKQKTRLALLDNRTAELATWDVGVLAELKAVDPSVFDGMFFDNEVEELCESEQQEGKESKPITCPACGFEIKG